jgi:hypothetical protein
MKKGMESYNSTKSSPTRDTPRWGVILKGISANSKRLRVRRI